MKKQLLKWLILFAVLTVWIAPHTIHASDGGDLPTITVSLKEEPTLKRRTITKDAVLKIAARYMQIPLSASSLRFRSTDPEVASVDALGVITTEKAGTADILVTSRDGKRQAVIRLTVVSRRNFLGRNKEEDSSLGSLLKGTGKGSPWM